MVREARGGREKHRRLASWPRAPRRSIDDPAFGSYAVCNDTHCASRVRQPGRASYLEGVSWAKGMLVASIATAAACTAFSAEEPLAAIAMNGPEARDAAVTLRADDAAAPVEASTDAADTGPSPVAIRDPGQPTFAIDRNEVTVAEFRAFRAAAAFDAGKLPAECSFKTDFGPHAGCGFLEVDTLPVHCVDWCDAYAYCAWAGKRLCGKRGGGPVATADFDKTKNDEWTRACAGPLTADRYAYGPKLDPTRCNTGALDAGAPVAPGSMPGCAGNEPGLFDMSGNLGEWENSCEPPNGMAPNGYCMIRGGSFHHPAPDSKCNYGVLGRRGDAFDDVGIRCCDDP